MNWTRGSKRVVSSIGGPGFESQCRGVTSRYGVNQKSTGQANVFHTVNTSVIFNVNVVDRQRGALALRRVNTAQIGQQRGHDAGARV